MCLFFSEAAALERATVFSMLSLATAMSRRTICFRTSSGIQFWLLILGPFCCVSVLSCLLMVGWGEPTVLLFLGRWSAWEDLGRGLVRPASGEEGLRERQLLGLQGRARGEEREGGGSARGREGGAREQGESTRARASEGVARSQVARSPMSSAVTRR